MRRKLIPQGGHSLTVYLPKKWVKEHRLEPGDEVEVEPAQDRLIVSAIRMQGRREISLQVTAEEESGLRTVLVNAYRQGYDRMRVQYAGDPQRLKDIVRRHLLGFDVLEENDGRYAIESITEPKVEDFERLIERQLFILLDILRGVGSRRIADDVVRLQEYDNFLKRCLTKRIHSPSSISALWQMLSMLVYAAKQVGHLEEYLEQEHQELSDDARAALQDLERMLVLLQKGYLSRKPEHLARLHERNAQFERKTAMTLLRGTDPVAAYFIVSAARFIYVTNSPVTSIIHAEALSAQPVPGGS